MKRFLLVAAPLLCGSAFCATTAGIAQEPTAAGRAATAQEADQAPSMANLTPEMWLYMQEMQRHDDPQMAVRRKAEQRAARRNQRIAARKWFGLSNARPRANAVPTMSTYSPFWAGNDSDPNRWNGIGPAVTQIERDDNLLR